MLSCIFPLLLFSTDAPQGRLLAAILLRIAFLAGFARFCGFDAALIIAFFAGGFGFFAAGFSPSNARAG